MKHRKLSHEISKNYRKSSAVLFWLICLFCRKKVETDMLFTKSKDTLFYDMFAQREKKNNTKFSYIRNQFDRKCDEIYFS